MTHQRMDASPASTVFTIQLPADGSSSSLSSPYLSTSTESQITLVGDPIDIFFSEWNIFNATIHVDGTPRYSFSTISTALDTTKRTAVIDIQSGVQLGKIFRSWVPGLQGRVEYGDGKEVEVKHWIRKLKQMSSEGLSQWVVTISAHGELIWRKDRKRRLVLYREDEPDKVLAWVKKRARSQLDEPGPFSLKLSREMENALYEIMVSFMLVEKRVRSEERTNDMIWRMSAGF